MLTYIKVRFMISYLTILDHINNINFVCVPAKHHNNMYVVYRIWIQVRNCVGASTDVDNIVDTTTKQAFNIFLLYFMDNPFFLMVHLYI